jgi:hypothetical protein
MSTKITFIVIVIFKISIGCFADWDPVVLNGIKWSSTSQGSETIRYADSVGIQRIPIKYHGGIDSNTDGVIEPREITTFSNWVTRYIPDDYAGPIVFDYEKPWWEYLMAKTISSEKLEELIGVYNQGLAIAKSIRPKAEWGYFGLPIIKNTSKTWLDQGLSLQPIADRCNGMYPSIYDCRPNRDITWRVKQHIEIILKQSGGTKPVYVFVSPRYCGNHNKHGDFIPDEIFLRQANAAMKATWTDEAGVKHKINGVVLWDAYASIPQEEWGLADMKHTRYLQLLEALVQAWRKESVGLTISSLENHTAILNNRFTGYEFSNLINREVQKNNITNETLQEGEIPEIENDRIESGRVHGNRVRE